MHKFEAMQALIWLEQLGSFSAVAEHYHMSKAKVSKLISYLESELNCQLVQRTTRQLSFTQAGKLYLQECKEIFEKLDNAEAQLQAKKSVIKGQLRVNMPMSLGILKLANMFSDFKRAHPDINLDLHLSDYAQDLVESGFDLGFRVTANLKDSSYIATKITQFTHKLYASPTYLKQYGVPKKMADLKQHQCLIYTLGNRQQAWPSVKQMQIRGDILSNNGLLLKTFALEGLGICSLPSFFVQKEVESKQLVELLNQTQPAISELYALYPRRQYQSKKLLECVEFAKNWFKEGKS